jgi:hypothetical protein
MYNGSRNKRYYTIINELGVTKVGHMKRILQAVKDLTV